MVSLSNHPLRSKRFDLPAAMQAGLLERFEPFERQRA